MTFRPGRADNPVMSPFLWSALSGRCRRRMAWGLALLALGLCYAGWSGVRLARGEPRSTIDAPIANAAAVMVAPPALPRGFDLNDDRQVDLFAAVLNRQDALFGMTVLMLRLIVAFTVAGLGLVLLTAGSTEWQLLSELARGQATSTASS